MNVPTETAEIRPDPAFAEADAADLKRPGNRGTGGNGELSADSFLPRGEFYIGLTHSPQGDMPPWTVCCGDGRAVAGHVPSKAIAEAIAKALNAAYHFE